MSSYEDYNRVSRSYDQTRQPIGLSIVLDGIAHCCAPLSALKLIDAGCGTGAYTAVLSDSVPNIVALDINEGMLGTAQKKCETLPVAFACASIQAIPIRDGAADGILNNLVLHHLPDSESEGYPAQRQVFEEFARVLRPGGALVIGVCTREQLRDGFWFNRLIPQAIDSCCKATAPIDAQIKMLQDCGFAVDEPAIPWDETLQGDAYFDRLGPLNPAWRDGDSVWSLAPRAELKVACDRVQEMEADGTLANYVADHNTIRRKTGQITYLCAIRK
ncbi:MAG: methyltransferase domain-containing protein [Alphaproteobacteria bacterium]|nr:methyltransferase domain-containing protein [Alphaproteobacteria bacterium]